MNRKSGMKMLPIQSPPKNTLVRTLIALFNKHFGRASLVAKLSLIVNIGLTYSIQGMKNNEKYLMDALIECHSSKYQDLNIMLLRLGLIKDKAQSHEVKEELTKIIEEGKNKR